MKKKASVNHDILLQTALKKHIQKNRAHYQPLFDLTPTVLMKAAQEWQSTDDPMEEGDTPSPEDESPTGGDIGISTSNTDEQQAEEIFGKSKGDNNFANPAGPEVQTTVGSLIIQLKNVVVGLAKNLFMLDLTEEDALKITKEGLKNISAKVCDIPIDTYVKDIDAHNEAIQKQLTNQPNLPKPPAAGTQPPSPNTSAPQPTVSEEPLEPATPADKLEPEVY